MELKLPLIHHCLVFDKYGAAQAAICSALDNHQGLLGSGQSEKIDQTSFRPAPTAAVSSESRVAVGSVDIHLTSLGSGTRCAVGNEIGAARRTKIEFGPAALGAGHSSRIANKRRVADIAKRLD